MELDWRIFLLEKSKTNWVNPYSTLFYLESWNFLENDSVLRYKAPSPDVLNAPGAIDPISDYMNVLSIAFSMFGLMMKVRVAENRILIVDVDSQSGPPPRYFLLQTTLLIFDGVLDDCFFQMKWCSWMAIFCSSITFTNSKNNDDTKQIFSSFM